MDPSYHLLPERAKLYHTLHFNCICVIKFNSYVITLYPIQWTTNIKCTIKKMNACDVTSKQSASFGQEWRNLLKSNFSIKFYLHIHIYTTSQVIKLDFILNYLINIIKLSKIKKAFDGLLSWPSDVVSRRIRTHFTTPS